MHMHSIRHAFSILLQNQLSVGGMGLKIASISKKELSKSWCFFLYKIPCKNKVRVMKETKEKTKKEKERQKKRKKKTKDRRLLRK